LAEKLSPAGSQLNESTESLSLRPVSLGDAELLLDWRNDPATRKASHNTDKVRLHEHRDWLSNSLRNSNRRLYIAEEGFPVGTVRADLSNGVWELSWTVNPAARGKGVGKRMVKLLAMKIAEPIRAEVKKGNSESARIAEHAGMHLELEIDGVLHFSRPALNGF
jgi:RimJ/RimL family protein N-acetyltransferase